MAATEKRRRHASQTLDISDAAEFEQQETELDVLELFYYLLEHIKQLVAAVVVGALVMLPVSYTHLTLPTKRIV